MSDTLALQKKVARAIAEQIRIQLSPQEEAVLENVKVVNPRSLRTTARGDITIDGLKKAAYYFNQAIKSDPNYSLPHTGLADIYQLSDRRSLLGKKFRKLSTSMINCHRHTTLWPGSFTLQEAGQK